MLTIHIPTLVVYVEHPLAGAKNRPAFPPLYLSPNPDRDAICVTSVRPDMQDYQRIYGYIHTYDVDFPREGSFGLIEVQPKSIYVNDFVSKLVLVRLQDEFDHPLPLCKISVITQAMLYGGQEVDVKLLSVKAR